jgi:hypothetical protein
MPKAAKVAGEIDSYCTKCEMVLNHRIVSMKDGKPFYVACLTCKTNDQRRYRPNAPGDRAAVATTSAGGGKTAAVRAPRVSRSSAATKAEQARLGREQTWEKAIAGRAMSDFKTYNVSAVFNEGDLVRHKKFGDGVIVRVIDAHKVEVLFKDEPKTLAHGMAS